jgi:endonuclease III
MKPADVEEFFRLLAKDRPEPATELEYINPYTLLVAVVLSAQATDVSVNKATEPLFKIADTPQAIVALGETRLKAFIKTIGLFNTKAKNVIALSRILIEKYDGKVPRDREALEALSGVGRKTANVVLNVAFGEPTIAVDTHIFRLGTPTCGRGQADESRAKEICAARASLAHPARAPCLRRPQAEMLHLRRARALRVQGQDDGGGLTGYSPSMSFMP